MNNSLLQKVKQKYNIVGNCDELNRALETALKIAPVDLNILIVGENGVGKEIFPKIIHDFSSRKRKRYFAINCGSIPEGTIDSELFGHEKGAFTGAISDREGYFAAADKGTLFLDEVGELPLSTQSRLLRVLESGEYIRVGASEVSKSNIRIIAATNVNLQKAISEGKFREDLYYRLSTIPIKIPPLRDRGIDIYMLFRKFALDMSEKYTMPPLSLSDDAKELLLHYSWPGNVRQLKNITENISVTSEERMISKELLQHYIPNEPYHSELVTINNKSNANSYENEREILYKVLFELRQDVTELKKIIHNNNSSSSNSSASVKPHNDVHEDKVSKALTLYPPEVIKKNSIPKIFEGEYIEETSSIEDIEKEMIKKALKRNYRNRQQTAEELGISVRTLYRKIKEYNLET